MNILSLFFFCKEKQRVKTTYKPTHAHPIRVYFPTRRALDLEGVEMRLGGGVEREQIGDAAWTSERSGLDEVKWGFGRAGRLRRGDRMDIL